MRQDGYFDSCGEGRIHYCTWTPEGQVRAVVQIIHGMAEYVERYDGFARYLSGLGYVVVAEDHMGHGKSIATVPGYFKGGWLSVVRDCLTLTELTKKQYPGIPYAMLGHSMGSFLLRTILCLYPDTEVDAAVISGTGWQPRAGLPIMEGICKAVCRKDGEGAPSPFLDHLIFGGYNQKIEHRRTDFDWLTRDQNIVDAYIAHPHCGFTCTAGMFRDLMQGLQIVEKPANLYHMKRERPILFLAGAMDPVGSYGKGPLKAAKEFRRVGVADVECKLYPLDRHEVLNELNRQEVYGDVSSWLEKKLFRKD